MSVSSVSSKMSASSVLSKRLASSVLSKTSAQVQINKSIYRDLYLVRSNTMCLTGRILIWAYNELVPRCIRRRRLHSM